MATNDKSRKPKSSPTIGKGLNENQLPKFINPPPPPPPKKKK